MLCLPTALDAHSVQAVDRMFTQNDNLIHFKPRFMIQFHSYFGRVSFAVNWMRICKLDDCLLSVEWPADPSQSPEKKDEVNFSKFMRYFVTHLLFDSGMRNVNKKLFVRKRMFLWMCQSKLTEAKRERKMNYGLDGNSKFISISHSFFSFLRFTRK